MPARNNRPKPRSVRRRSAPPPLPLERLAGDELNAYSAADIQRLVDVPERLVDSLVRAGHLHPARLNDTVSYSFQDLLVLRTASALRAAKIPAPKIVDAVGKIREALPPGSSLNVLSVVPHGEDVVIREGSRLWESTTGQYALPLTVDARTPSVTTLKR